MSLTKAFKEIMTKQRKMGYSFPDTLHSPATTIEIEKTEAGMGFPLNDELKKLYSIANGSEYTHNHLGIIPIHRLLSLDEAKSAYNLHVKGAGFKTSFEDWETGETPGTKLFPFLADDSCHTYWVDLNKGTKNYGKVYDALFTGVSPFYAFTSLTTMFEAIAECYRKDVFFLDEEGWLEDDFSEFSKVCQKHNSEIEYWKCIATNKNSSNV